MARKAIKFTLIPDKNAPKPKKGSTTILDFYKNKILPAYAKGISVLQIWETLREVAGYTRTRHAFTKWLKYQIAKNQETIPESRLPTPPPANQDSLRPAHNIIILGFPIKTDEAKRNDFILQGGLMPSISHLTVEDLISYLREHFDGVEVISPILLQHLHGISYPVEIHGSNSSTQSPSGLKAPLREIKRRWPPRGQRPLRNHPRKAAATRPLKPSGV